MQLLSLQSDLDLVATHYSRSKIAVKPRENIEDSLKLVKNSMKHTTNDTKKYNFMLSSSIYQC